MHKAKKKLHSTSTQLLHNYDYYVLKILQISETWAAGKKITESEMVFELFCCYLQMIILFLKMATFGWNNEWGIATA